MGYTQHLHTTAAPVADSQADDSDVTVYQVLEKALNDLTDVCDAVEDKFTTSRDEFNAANPDRGKA